MADTEIQHAANVAEAIRADVETDSLKRLDDSNSSSGALPPITVSIGCVVCRFPPITELADALRLADEALYASVRAGRNRVTMANLAHRQAPQVDTEDARTAVIKRG